MILVCRAQWERPEWGQVVWLFPTPPSSFIPGQVPCLRLSTWCLFYFSSRPSFLASSLPLHFIFFLSLFIIPIHFNFNSSYFRLDFFLLFTPLLPCFFSSWYHLVASSEPPFDTFAEFSSNSSSSSSFKKKIFSFFLHLLVYRRIYYLLNGILSNIYTPAMPLFSDLSISYQGKTGQDVGLEIPEQW